MKFIVASAALAAFAAFSAPVMASTSTGTSVDNSVIEKKCKKGFVRTSSGKCVRSTRGSGGSQPRGSY